MPGNGRGRLSGEQAASNTTSPVTGFAVDSKPAKLTPVDALDDIAQHVDGAFVLVVKVNGGRYRRRCFMTAASAERAARNALDAGHNATVFLAHLKPLWKLAGASQDLFSTDAGEPGGAS
jgi:hypothetical protein